MASQIRQDGQSTDVQEVFVKGQSFIFTPTPMPASQLLERAAGQDF